MDDQRHYLPVEWNDAERIRTLMGPMPSAQDTVARNARLTFWTAAIHQWCNYTKKLTFTLQESQSAFRRGTQQPLCLPDTLLHMNRLGETTPIDELPVGEKSEESWVGWGLQVFVSSPSRFAWKKVKQALGANNLLGKVFVNTRLLQEMSDDVLKTFWGSAPSMVDIKNKSMTFAALYSKVGHCVGSADNLHLVVEALTYHGMATTVIHKDTIYVKLIMPGDTKKPLINELEIAENELISTERLLEGNIDKLDADIANLQKEVKAAIMMKSKAKALSLLRRKKRAEKSLSTQAGALENVSACLLQLEETQINKQVLGTFRFGIEAIRSSLSGENSADKVATTLDDLQEVLEECQDISSLLSTGVKSQLTEIDDDELSQELDQLVSQDQAINHIDQNLADQMRGMELPEVPKGNPLSSIASQEPALSPPSLSPI